jgi:hypothetical protein
MANYHYSDLQVYNATIQPTTSVIESGLESVQPEKEALASLNYKTSQHGDTGATTTATELPSEGKEISQSADGTRWKRLLRRHKRKLLISSLVLC